MATTPTAVVCTLYIMASNQFFTVDKLTQKEAAAKYWEYAVHENYAEVAMEAVYCNKKLAMILKSTNLDAVPGGGKDMPQGQVPGEPNLPTTPTVPTPAQ